VSSSGKDLVALTGSGTFIWIPGFERLINHEANLSDIAVVLNFSPSSSDNFQDISIYLALGESNEKAAVATVSSTNMHISIRVKPTSQRAGLYVISLDPEINKLTAEPPPRPGVSVCRITRYEHNRHLSFITCLQMTNTGVFFNWYPSSAPNRPSHPAQPLLTLPPLQPQPPPPPPVSAPVNHTAALVQGVQAHDGGGGNVFMPELHLVDYSDDNNPAEDATSVAPFNTNQDGLPPLVDVPDEEDEDDQMADDDDFEDMEEPVEIDDIQFNGDGSH